MTSDLVDLASLICPLAALVSDLVLEIGDVVLELREVEVGLENVFLHHDHLPLQLGPEPEIRLDADLALGARIDVGLVDRVLRHALLLVPRAQDENRFRLAFIRCLAVAIVLSLRKHEVLVAVVCVLLRPLSADREHLLRFGLGLGSGRWRRQLGLLTAAGIEPALEIVHPVHAPTGTVWCRLSLRGSGPETESGHEGRHEQSQLRCCHRNTFPSSTLYEGAMTTRRCHLPHHGAVVDR